jgi:hypothetical protein
MTEQTAPGQVRTIGGNGSGPELDRVLRELDELHPQASRAARVEMRSNFAEEPREWQIYTLVDAYRPRPPLEYAVSGLFSLPGLSIIYGAPGTLKSMLMVDMAACVAAGLPWLPPLPAKEDVSPLETLQVPVLWCDFDNGKHRTDERIEAAGRVRDLEPETTPLHYVVMPTPWLVGSDPTSVDNLRRNIDRLGARLVIVDNLSTVSGDADENGPAIGHVLTNFRCVAEDTGAAMILIHHQRKSTGLTSRVGESLRGHSSIEAALDLALLIERKEHAATVKLKSTKVRGEDVLPFGDIFTYEHRTGNDDLHTMQFFGTPAEDLTSDAAIRASILEAVSDTPEIRKGALIKAVKNQLSGVGINRIRNNIDHLVSTGDLIVSPGKRTAKLYRLGARSD